MPDIDTAWFVAAEEKYGGFVSGIPRREFSPHEQRPADDVYVYMLGGDRMSPAHHNYAHTYALFLRHHARRRDSEFVIVEMGVLTGTGLALWSDLFPRATLIGLDIDLGYVEQNIPKLKEKGAFKHKDPELHKIDQLDPGLGQRFAQIIAGRKIDIMVDDGCHRDIPILDTYTAAAPYLQDNAVYFVEDNWVIAGHLSTKVGSAREVVARGSMTVVRKACV